MNAIEQVLCRLQRIESKIGITNGDIPTGNSTLYTTDWIGEQVLTLDNSVVNLTVPALAEYCEIEVKGSGVVLSRFISVPSNIQGNKFYQDDLFSLNKSEMIKRKFTSTLNNTLFVNYFKIIQL